MSTPVLERDLVNECRRSAQAMGAFLAEVGQRRAKGSGTTTGFPDLVLICAGRVHLIEVKRPKSDGTPGGEVSLGQQAFMQRAAEQGVTVHAIWSVREFEEIVNECRRPCRHRDRIGDNK